MLVLMIRDLYSETAGVSDGFFEYRHEIFNNGCAAVINSDLFFCAADFRRAETLDCKPDTPSPGVVGCKTIHIEYGEVDPCRRPHDHRSFHRFEHELLLLKAERLEILPGGERQELVFHEIKVAPAYHHLRHR